MRNFQDTFETSKQSFISAFLVLFYHLRDFRSGQIVPPILIGRAKPLRCARFFGRASFALQKKIITSAKLHRIGKTMKKL